MRREEVPSERTDKVVPAQYEVRLRFPDYDAVITKHFVQKLSAKYRLPCRQGRRGCLGEQRLLLQGISAGLVIIEDKMYVPQEFSEEGAKVRIIQTIAKHYAEARLTSILQDTLSYRR
jgi:hypothetical protein